MLKFNVGGIFFETLRNTVEPCRALSSIVYANQYSKDDIFLDRDPVVFAALLKLLRGYQCPETLFNIDVLSELVYWNHEMLDVELPAWIKPQPLTVNTLDPYESECFSTTHGLLSVESILRLVSMKLLDGPLSRFTVCKAVGAVQGWIESGWVENKEIELATVRYQFQKYFDKPRLFYLKK